VLPVRSVETASLATTAQIPQAETLFQAVFRCFFATMAHSSHIQRSRVLSEIKGDNAVAKSKKLTAIKGMGSAGKALTAKKHSAACSSSEAVVTVDRRASRDRDRRKPADRRKIDAPVAVERRKLERRVKVSRRRQIDPTTCERDYSDDEVEFMSALELYKRTSGRMFPTCSEMLEVLRGLGYQKRPKTLESTTTEPVAVATPTAAWCGTLSPVATSQPS
jgi:hypothetical protein